MVHIDFRMEATTSDKSSSRWSSNRWENCNLHKILRNRENHAIRWHFRRQCWVRLNRSTFAKTTPTFIWHSLYFHYYAHSETQTEHMNLQLFFWIEKFARNSAQKKRTADTCIPVIHLVFKLEVNLVHIDPIERLRHLAWCSCLQFSVWFPIW